MGHVDYPGQPAGAGVVLPNLLLDAHPLDNLRVNVNAQMFDPIYDKLGVTEGDAMYLAPNERINIWGPNA